MDRGSGNPEELLDRVDWKDRVIGQVSKSEANRNPKVIHREVVVILYDDRKRVLFQQRSWKKLINPGVWVETCAGHVPRGMAPEAAAHKELMEELGFDTGLVFIEKHFVRLPTETHFSYWFLGKFPKGTRITLEPREVGRVKFLSEKGLEELLKSGEVYDPFGLGGYPKDMIKEFWRGAFQKFQRKLRVRG